MAAAPPQRLGTARSESNLSINSNLPEGKRERLLSLKKREDLKDALTERFKSRYGHGAQERADDEISVASTAIRREVDRFTGAASVTEANLGRLERRLQKRAQPGQGAGRPEDEGSVSGVSAYSGMSVGRMSRGGGSRSMGSIGENVVYGGGARKDFDWGKLDEYALYLHQQDAVRQKAGVAALQRKLRKDLDLQVAEHEKKKIAKVEDEKQYFLHQCEEIQLWKENEQKRAEEVKQKVMKEKRDRDEQLQLEKQIKKEALEKKKSEEAALVTKITKEMAMEKKRLEKKRLQTRESMRKVFEENMREQQQREEAKKQQAEKDSRAMKEYNALLDKLEEERAQELQSRVSKQKDLMDKMMAKMEETEGAMGDEDAQRANRQKEEADARYDEAERRKQDRLKNMRMETRDFLFKQMAEKDGKKRQTERLKQLQAQILEVDTQEYKEIEEQKAKDRQEKYRLHGLEIEHQIAVNNAKKETMMSETEMKLNKGLLDLVDRTLDERDRTSPPEHIGADGE